MKVLSPKAPNGPKKLRAGGVKLPAAAPKQAIAVGVKSKNKKSGFSGLKQKVPAAPIEKPKVKGKKLEVKAAKKTAAAKAASDDDEDKDGQDDSDDDEVDDEE
jgi:hypothetical protein